MIKIKLKTAIGMLVCLFVLCACACAEEGFSAEARLKGFKHFVDEGCSMPVTGDIVSDEPIRSIYAVITDLRAMSTINEYDWDAEEDVCSVQAYPIFKALLRRVGTGEKHITVKAYGDGGECTVVDCDLYFAGELKAPANILSECEISCSDGRKWIWNDGRCWSAWMPKNKDDTLAVKLPDGKTASGITLIWRDKPDWGEINYLGADGKIIDTVKLHEGFCPLNAYYAIPEGVASFTLNFSGKNSAIEEMLVYARGKESEVVQKWSDTPEKLDLMFISTHQDDEHLFFGALIEKYAKTKECGIVYMVDCGHNRYIKALDGLWSAGLDNYPIFMGLSNGMPGSRKAAYSLWGLKDEIIGMLTEQIRKYRPEVIVTHDLKGEYGQYHHIVTAECVAAAVEAAADPGMYPESAEEYGAWQVKKLYLHMYGDDPLEFDWDEPLEGFDGMTGLEATHMCYSKHRSQRTFVPFKYAQIYSCERFGLYYTAVGDDKEGTGLFENID